MSSFVPAVFSTTGGMGQHAPSLYKRIAALLSEKSGEPYSAVLAWVRCRLIFALLRARTMCIRGSRGLRHGTLAEYKENSAVLVTAKAAIRCY